MKDQNILRERVAKKLVTQKKIAIKSEIEEAKFSLWFNEKVSLNDGEVARLKVALKEI